MNPTFYKGQIVSLEYHGQKIDATVMLASENGRSLLLWFDGFLHTPSGGAHFLRIPLLLDDDGIYRDLRENAPATLTIKENHGNASHHHRD